MTTKTTNSDDRISSMTRAALELGKLGYKVFPIVQYGKCPYRGSAGFKDARSSEEDIRSLFGDESNANIGISTDTGLAVVDIDKKNNGWESFQKLQQEIGSLPPTVKCTTPGGGMHYYFSTTGRIVASRTKVLPGIDIRAKRGYVVAPPSIRENGRRYEWVEGHSPFDMSPALIPDELLVIINGGDTQANRLGIPADRSKPQRSSISKIIKEGSRNSTLASLAGTLNRRGLSEVDILDNLRRENTDRCEPPLPDREVAGIARSISNYPATDPIGTKEFIEPPLKWVAPSVPGSSIDEILDVYEEMMPGADPGMLRVSLAAYAANWLDAPPVWLMLVSGPGTGKTRTLTALQNLPSIQSVGNLSEPALVSGTPEVFLRPGSHGGILLQPGEFRVMICDDFTRTLAESEMNLGRLIGTLGEIYEGRLTKSVGSGGGLSIHWEGKRGLLIGSTLEHDKHDSLHRRMAPRFLVYRRKPYKPSDDEFLLLPEDQDSLREMLSELIPGLFSHQHIGDLARCFPNIDQQIQRRLNELAIMVARGRGIVERNVRGSVESPPEIEPPTRLFNSLVSLLRGYYIIGIDTDTAMGDLVNIALGTIGPRRSSVISVLIDNGNGLGKKQIRKRGHLSEYKADREINDLVELGILRKSGRGNSAIYHLCDDTVRCVIPAEKENGTCVNTGNDISCDSSIIEGSSDIPLDSSKQRIPHHDDTNHKNKAIPPQLDRVVGA